MYVVVWILTLFALRFLDDAPLRPWPTAIFLLAAAALAGVAGWIEMRWRALWWSAILVNLAFTIVWLFKRRRSGNSYPSDSDRSTCFTSTCLAATLPTLGWVLIFRHWKTRPDAAGLPARAAAVHRYVVPIAVVLLVALATLWMQSALGGGTALPNPYLSSATILIVGFACWSCYWDDDMHWQSLGLYATGLCGAVALLQFA